MQKCRHYITFQEKEWGFISSTATDHSLCEEFGKLIQGEFEISMMEELKFFLGLQIK